MKYGILALLFALVFLPCQRGFTQGLKNEVIGSAGDDFVFEDIEVSWTVGESIIELYQSGNVFISQGFHQPEIKFSEIHEQERPDFFANIFPNPTNRFILVELTGESEMVNFNLILSDLTGRVLLNRIISPADPYQIDLADYSRGILLLKIIRVNNGSQRTFKVVRTN